VKREPLLHTHRFGTITRDVIGQAAFDRVPTRDPVAREEDVCVRSGRSDLGTSRWFGSVAVGYCVLFFSGTEGVASTDERCHQHGP